MNRLVFKAVIAVFLVYLSAILVAGGASAATISVLGGDADNNSGDAVNNAEHAQISVPSSRLRAFDWDAFNALTIQRKVMIGLDNSFWIADGANSAHHAYVFFSPESTESAAFFEATRTRPRGVQLRWIPVSSSSIASRNRTRLLAASRSFDILENLFDTGYIPSAELGHNEYALAAADYNNDIYHAMQIAFASLGFPVNSQPVVLLQTDYNVRVLAGVETRHMEHFYDDITERRQSRNVTPRAMAFVQHDINILPVREDFTYINRSPLEEDVFLRPFGGSDILTQIAPNEVLNVLGVVEGTDWLQVRPLVSDNIIGYVRGHDGVGRFAQMQYDMLPVKRETYRTTREATICMYPVEGAPIIDTLLKGSRIVVMENVDWQGESWYSTPYFSDNRRAFIRAADIEAIDERNQ